MEIELIILTIILYTIPLYIANAAPVLFQGKIPVDLGASIRGKRVLGDGKTFSGALAGIAAGSLAGLIIALAFPQILTQFPLYFPLAVTLSFGAIIGDMVKSFFKRRLGIASGAKWFLADQLDFVVGGLLFSFLIRFPEAEVVLVLLLATVFIHIATNFAAFKLKLKKVPW